MRQTYWPATVNIQPALFIPLCLYFIWCLLLPKWPWPLLFSIFSFSPKHLMTSLVLSPGALPCIPTQWPPQPVRCFLKLSLLSANVRFPLVLRAKSPLGYPWGSREGVHISKWGIGMPLPTIGTGFSFTYMETRLLSHNLTLSMTMRPVTHLLRSLNNRVKWKKFSFMVSDLVWIWDRLLVGIL